MNATKGKTPHPFAERLKRIRTQKGLSQGAVARHFGMSPVGYGGWERGDSEPSIENLVKLCRLFGCSADSLVGLADMPDRPDLGGIKKNAKAAQTALASLLDSLDGLC